MIADQLSQLADQFVADNWSGNESRWFDALAASHWLTFDWPQEFNGLNWSRAQQLAVVTSFAKHHCPLMPESLSIAAPLITCHGTPLQQSSYLRLIAEDPRRWKFGLNDDCSFGLDQSDSFVMRYQDRVEQIGETDAGAKLIAISFSPALTLHEHLTTVAFIEAMNKHWDEPEQSATELVDSAALTALFLRNTPATDRQLALKISESKLPLYSSLFQSLGYYALLDPDPELTANEPLPFEKERQHLKQLRGRADRDDMIQKDALFLEHIGGL
jgi:hypothetical protein